MALVAKEGIPHISIPFFLAVILLIAGLPKTGAAAVTVAVAIALFFRDPERPDSAQPGDILSPADGRIVAVGKVEEDRYLGGQALRISVFMSIFNVHVNRMPMDSKVLAVKRVPGGFAMAHLDDAGVINERTEIVLEDGYGRIICRIKEGDDMKRGSRFGLICFGSRVDMYLPLEASPQVEIGARVRAGQSVLARMGEGNLDG